MKKMVFVGLSALILFASPVWASESAWVVNKNSVYVEMEPTYRRSSELDLQEYSLENRIEWGILEHSSFVFSVPFRNKSQDADTASDPRLSNNGLTDVYLGLHHQFLSKPMALSFKGGFKIPTGYRPEFMPSIGERQLDIEGLLLGGYIFPQLPLFIQGGAGYRYRSEYDTNHSDILRGLAEGKVFKKPSDQVLGFFEFGGWLLPRLFLSLYFDGEVGVNQAEAIMQSKLSMTPKLGWRINSFFDLSFQYEQVLWLQNRPQTSGFKIGGHYRFGTPLSRDIGFRGAVPKHAYYDPDFD